jgi:hypothetical protein
MKNQSNLSQTIIGVILLCYWIPLSALIIYSFSNKSWPLLVAGLLMSTIGAIFLWVFIKSWEEKTQVKFKNHLQYYKNSLSQHKVALEEPKTLVEEKLTALEIIITDYEKKQIELSKELEQYKQVNITISNENKDFHYHIETLKQELESVKNYLNEQVAYYNNLLNDHQRTILELRETLQSKQQVTMQLESKVRDLSYEIKTILQIAEGPQNMPSEKKINLTVLETSVNSQFKEREIEESKGQIHTFEEALMVLKRSLDAAQRISGYHFLKSQRFKDLPLENYALDLRRLFDHFQNEAEGILFVYSHKEEKMLFVTDQINKLLGITPERFLQNFQEVIQEGKDNWNRAISQLSFKSEAKVTLPMKTKKGEEIEVICVLGIIPTGIFHNHVLGVFFCEHKSCFKPLVRV